jgi:cellulose synthase (UDP-forming)
MTRDRLSFWGWVFSAILLGAVAAQPVGTSTQLTTGLMLLAVLLVVGVAVTIVIRYFYWRTTSTLPSPDSLINFIPGLWLYIMELFTLFMLAISMFIVADPIERPRARQLSDADKPSVDVFIPTYNEDKLILATTMSAALAMDYPARSSAPTI